MFNETVSSDAFNEIEDLAIELRSLVGYGALGHHVIRCRVLRRLVAEKHQGLSVAALKQAMIREVTEATGYFPEGESVKELLKLGHKYRHMMTMPRREEVIIRLAMHCSVETWRKGYELDFLRAFAIDLYEYLTEPPRNLQRLDTTA